MYLTDLTNHVRNTHTLNRDSQPVVHMEGEHHVLKIAYIGSGCVNFGGAAGEKCYNIDSLHTIAQR